MEWVGIGMPLMLAIAVHAVILSLSHPFFVFSIMKTTPMSS